MSSQGDAAAEDFAGAAEQTSLRRATSEGRIRKAELATQGVVYRVVIRHLILVAKRLHQSGFQIAIRWLDGGGTRPLLDYVSATRCARIHLPFAMAGGSLSCWDNRSNSNFAVCDY